MVKIIATWFKFAFCLFKVPAFETSDGKCISESNAIAHYVANAQLRGKTDLDQAQVLQWINFADSEILPASCAWVFPILGILQFNKQVSKFVYFLRKNTSFKGKHVL